MKRAVGADLVIQGAGEVYGGVGDVDASGLRAESRPRHGVHPEMALEVEKRLARDVADLAAFDVGEGYPALLEALDIVELGGGVDGGALVPVGTVGCESFIHSAFIIGCGSGGRVKSGCYRPIRTHRRGRGDRRGS